jgi:5-formyltetrahydrofolate cyclo-ligase
VLRPGLLAARRGLDRAALAAAATRVRGELLAHLPRLLARRPDGPAGAEPGGAEPGGAPVVAGYVPLMTEPGGPELPEVLRAALSPDGRLLLPVLRADNDLDWAVYDGRLSHARLGLAQPVGPRLGPAGVARASLVVVPALAVDRDGVRLGRGGGSYDRALARVPGRTPVVALLHDGELRDVPLPAGPHDRRVSAVITPSLGLVWLG